MHVYGDFKVHRGKNQDFIDHPLFVLPLLNFFPTLFLNKKIEKKNGWKKSKNFKRLNTSL